MQNPSKCFQGGVIAIGACLQFRSFLMRTAATERVYPANVLHKSTDCAAVDTTNKSGQLPGMEAFPIRHIQMMYVWNQFWEPHLFTDTFQLFTWNLKLKTKILQYFSKPGDTFLSGRRLVLPRLASPGLALLCLVMPCLVLLGFECDAFSPNIKNGIHKVGLF